MSIVYVVMGTTGEYSDHREWPVCAFKDERSAQQHVTACDEEARRVYIDVEVNFRLNRITGNPDSKLDPNMETDYTGTKYYYFETELRDEQA